MKKSAGLLLYRKINKEIEFLLVHPGGPFWKNKDLNSWSIPKGEFTDDENPLDAARREFSEETGISCDGDFIELSPLKQRSGKLVYAFAIKKNINEESIKSNLFEMEWPPKSGKYQSFPEVDKANWFTTNDARQKIVAGQAGFIDELIDKLEE